MIAVAQALAATVLGLALWIAFAFGGEQVSMAVAQSAAARWLDGGDAGLLLMMAGLPVQAAALRWWLGHVGRPRRALGWPAALSAAAASLGWWFICLNVLYGAFAGDPRPGTLPPPAEQVYRREAVVAAVMIALHTALFWWWRRRAR